MKEKVIFFSPFTRRYFFHNLIVYLSVLIIFFVLDSDIKNYNNISTYFTPKTIIIYIGYIAIVILSQSNKIYSFIIKETIIIKKYPFKFKISNNNDKINLKDILVVELHINTKRGILSHLILYNQNKSIGMLSVSHIKDIYGSLRAFNKLDIPIFIRQHIKEKDEHIQVLKSIKDKNIYIEESLSFSYEKKYDKYDKLSFRDIYMND